MFVVPESGASKPENRFEFQVGKKTYSVPKLGFVPGEASALFAVGDERNGSLACFDDPEARALYAGWSPDQRDAFDKEWIEASKVSPGESQGSASS